MTLPAANIEPSKKKVKKRKGHPESSLPDAQVAVEDEDPGEVPASDAQDITRKKKKKKKVKEVVESEDDEIVLQDHNDLKAIPTRPSAQQRPGGPPGGAAQPGGAATAADGAGEDAPKSCDYTISIAVAGSIIDNAQSLELATALAGQVARAAAIFKVDEVVVFDDNGDEEGGGGVAAAGKQRRWRDDNSDSGGAFLARLLQYLETPQYLRRALIPMHPDLRYAGLLPPLDAPHHARFHEWLPYREGVVVESPRGGAAGAGGSSVNVGLQKEVRISQSIRAGLRVTVAMGHDRQAALLPGTVLRAVSAGEAHEKAGLYWGYRVRLAPSLSRVLTDCPYPGGYDYTLGTSEHGEKVRGADLVIPPFKHLLVVFGGLAGIEESAEMDDSIEVKDAGCLFDRYLNTCPSQGSRTIRTEEAILISMAYLDDAIRRSIARLAL